MRLFSRTTTQAPTRRLAFLGLALVFAILNCGKDVTGPLGAAARYARNFAFNPVFPPAFQAAGGSAAGIVAFNRVHVVLHHSDGTVALDTTIDFPAGADEVTLNLTVKLLDTAPASGEPMNLDLGYLNAAGDVVFHGGPVLVTAAPPAVPGQPNPPVSIPVSYTGPGSSAVGVAISPHSVTVGSGAGFTFSAVAKDAGGSPLALTPIIWNSLDPSIATITSAASGAVIAQNLRGTARIVAQLLTGPADTVQLIVTLPATQIIAQSGNAQNGVVGTNLVAPLVVKVAASDGVGVAGTTVNFVVATGGGSVANASVVSDGNGLAQTTWKLGGGTGGQSVTAAAGSLVNSPLTFTANAQAATASKLVITTQPANAVAGATLASVTVAAEDNNGNVATTFNGTVTIALGGGPAGATLSGSANVNAVAGIAVFPSLSINKNGTGYTLVFSAAALTSVTTNSFDIALGPPSKLAFTVQPSSANAGSPIAPPIVVSAQDAAGNLTPSFTGTVSLALASNPGAAAIGGSLAAPAVAGSATFANVTLNRPGVDYGISASASGLSPASSGSFGIAIGPPAIISLVSGGGQSGATGAALAQPIVVRVTDLGGNTVAGVPVSFAAANGGSTSPSSGVSNAVGLISTAWTLGGSLGAQTMSATSATTSLTISATATTSGVSVLRTWTGTISTNWAIAGNWSPSGVPTSSDDVIIPIVTNVPIISAPVTVKNLNVTNDATLTNTSTLTVSGDLDSYVMNGGGTVILTGTGHLTGLITGNLLVNGGVRTIINSTSILGNVTVSGATSVLDIGGQYVEILGSFTTASGGVLQMIDVNGNDELLISGNATFAGGSTAGRLTGGYLEVDGNFTQSGSPSSFSADAALETDVGNFTSGGGALRLTGVTLATAKIAVPRSGRATTTAKQLLRPAPRRSARSVARAAAHTARKAIIARRKAVFAARRQQLRANGLSGGSNEIAAQVLPGNSTISFANPGFGAGASHFGDFALNGYEDDLSTNVFIEGKLIGNGDGGVLAGMGSNKVLTSKGVDASFLSFSNVSWVLLDGIFSTYMYQMDFENMDPTVDQFTVQRTGNLPPACDCSSPLNLDYWTFGTVPTTGHYIRAVDTDGANPSILTLNMYLPTPAVNGGFVSTAGGAIINNWPQLFEWVDGGVSTNWNDGSNWSTGHAPGSADDILIRSTTTTNPVLNGSANFHNITIEAGKSIELNENALFAYGNISAPVGTTAITCVGGGNFYLYGDGGVNNVVGKFCDTQIFGHYQVSGPGNLLSVSQPVYIYGNLKVNGGEFDANELWTQGNGTLTMQDPADAVVIGSGGAYFDGGSTTGLMTAGTLTINGGCVHTTNSDGAPDAFAPSGTHTTVFNNGTSSAEFRDNVHSGFQNVGMTGGSTLQLLSSVNINGTLARSFNPGAITISSSNSSTLTVSGLNQTGATAMSFINVALRFVDGTSNATFNQVSFIGLPTGAVMFEVARTTGGPFTFTSLNFNGLLSGGLYMLNSGSQAVTLVSPNPSAASANSGCGCVTYQNTTGTGSIAWP